MQARTYVVDAGNSRVKIGCFEAGALQEVVVMPHETYQQVRLKPASAAALLSVSIPEQVLADWLQAQGITQTLVFNSQSPLGFSSAYTSPQTLGSDRKMLIRGANERFPGCNRLIIGVGSCITYDAVDAQQQHLGGDISPGMHMRWKAMHQQTARLPQVELPVRWPDFGTDTISALQAGVLQGMVAELQGRIQQFQALLPDLTIILSGGDAQLFEKRMDSRIFAEPNLALYGLHALLK